MSKAGLILGLRPANERRCYFVTASLIGRAQTYNQPWQVVEIDLVGKKAPSFHIVIIMSLCAESCLEETWKYIIIISQYWDGTDRLNISLWTFHTCLTDWYHGNLLGNWFHVNATEPIDDKLTLVQIMAWCLQATSYYLIQCWPRSVSTYGVTRPQWVNYK